MTDQPSFKAGDRVRFNSQVMTVVRADGGDYVSCEWTGPKGGHHRKQYHVSLLKHYVPGKSRVILAKFTRPY